MKRFVPAALLRRITGDMARYGCFAALVLGGAAAGSCLAADPSFEHLTVTVEDISYQGNSRYKVEITVYNRSDKTAVLQEHSETFYVQTEVLGRWEKLSASASSPTGSALLPPGKGLRVVHILSIPLAIPSLYRNSEGDINMTFKYRIRFALGSGSRLLGNAGESSYWITPKTNTWVLREGM